jgi:hypothetical protein
VSVVDMSEPKSFWTSLPGILTGIAALLGSVAAVIGALAALGIFGASDESRNASAGTAGVQTLKSASGAQSLRALPTAWRAQWVNGTTTFQELSVRGVPSRTQIEVRCAGRGCFHGVLRREVPDGSPSVSLARSIPPLRGGATLEVRVLNPGAVGKILTLTTHSSGIPTSEVSCLPPGQLVAQPC